MCLQTHEGFLFFNLNVLPDFYSKGILPAFIGL